MSSQIRTVRRRENLQLWVRRASIVIIGGFATALISGATTLLLLGGARASGAFPVYSAPFVITELPPERPPEWVWRQKNHSFDAMFRDQ